MLVAGAVFASACESTPILLYHSVGEPIDPPRWVAKEALRAQLVGLLDEGFEPITASELDAIEDGVIPGPRQPLLVTFDDGYRNFYDQAFPVLRELGVRSTLFLISSRVEESAEQRSDAPAPQYVTWQEVEEMRGQGVEMQSHTRTHRRLRALSDDEIRAELWDSKRELEARLGAEVSVIAYPFGSASSRVERIAEEVGYQSGHGVEAGLGGRMARQRVSVHGEHETEDVSRSLDASWWGRASGVR